MRLDPEYRRKWTEDHPLYSTWCNIRQRCGLIRGATAKMEECYRGIGMCDAWASSYREFERWALDNGWSKGLQVARKDKSSDFSPENCTVVPQTKAVNMRRNTVTAGGVPFRDVIGRKTSGRGDRQYRRSVDRYVKCGWDVKSSVHPAVVPPSENGFITNRITEERQ